MRFSRHSFLSIVFLVTCAVGIFSVVFSVDAQVAQQSKVAVQQVANAAGVSGGTDLITLIGRIINIFLGTLGVVFLGYMLYAGYLWMTSGGDTKKVEQAQIMIRNAVIGLIILASAFAITAWIIKALQGAVDGGGISGSGADQFSPSYPTLAGSLGHGIEFHIPVRNATDVPRNTPIIITFKQPVDPASFIEGWTLANSATQKGLNANKVKIFKTKEAVDKNNPSNVLTSAEARVTYTADHKTFVIKPVQWLGSAVENTQYTVRLQGGNTGILEEAGGPVFNGSFGGGYEWGFEVSTKVDTTPPKVLFASPKSGKVARNVVIQITFNESIDPTAATGIFKDKAGFKNIEVTAGGVNLDGEYKISNQYRTVEFIPTEQCGISSCGKAIYCLPGSTTIDVAAHAATLSTTFPAPLAEAVDQGPGSSLYDGIVDVVGNSLDGNKDGEASGPGKDDYLWSFGTSGDLVLSAPTITYTFPDASPGPGQSNIAVDAQVLSTFDRLMRSSTFNSDAAYIEAKGANETDPDTFWWSVAMNLLGDSGKPLEPGEDATTAQLVMNHRPYIPSPPPVVGKDENNYYNSFLLSDLEDEYQNCFVPVSSPVCKGSANTPTCCNNSPQSADCNF